MHKKLSVFLLTLILLFCTGVGPGATRHHAFGRKSGLVA